MLKIGLRAYKAVYFLRRHLNYFASLLLITQGWGRKASSMWPDVSCALVGGELILEPRWRVCAVSEEGSGFREAGSACDLLLLPGPVFSLGVCRWAAATLVSEAGGELTAFYSWEGR